MVTYAECWAPETIEEAAFLIDTTRDGDAFWAEGRQIARLLSAHMPHPCLHVLEYGCGVGRILQATGARYRYGLDVSAPMLSMASVRDWGATFHLTNGSSMDPMLSGSMDFVYSWLTLQHMDAPDVAAILAETRRVLRPGGRCAHLFSAFGLPWSPDATVPRGPLVWAGQRAGSHSPAHGTLAYDESLIRSLAGDAGLTVREVVPVEGPSLLLVGER